MPRVKVFIDYQNVYVDARRAFFGFTDPVSRGQFSPRRLGEVLLRGPDTTGRTLSEVRVYAGRPSPKDSKTYGAHMRQESVWSKQANVTVVTRQLRYPRNWPTEKAVQKGIDVHLAVDLIRGYVMDEFDIGIVASTDTDLVPALEAVFEFDRRRGYQPVEVCAWKTATFLKQLRIEGRSIWCHELREPDYNRVADLTDYNIR